MIVTIIGSLSRRNEINKIKDFFSGHGHHVYAPTDEGRQDQPLIDIQRQYIDKIKEADLIIVVSKWIRQEMNGKSNFIFEIGESTSYEIAIAESLCKQVVFV